MARSKLKINIGAFYTWKFAYSARLLGLALERLPITPMAVDLRKPTGQGIGTKLSTTYWPGVGSFDWLR